MDRRNALLAFFVPFLLLLSGCRRVRHICGDVSYSWDAKDLETSGSVEPAAESTHASRVELAGTLESFDERLDDEDATRDPHDRRYGWRLSATNDEFSSPSPKIAIDLRVQSRLSWTSDVYCD